MLHLAKDGRLASLRRMTTAALLKIILTMTAEDQKALAAIAARMKQRHASVRRQR
jgi:hypothetical protein